MPLPFKIQSQTSFNAISLEQAKDQCRVALGFHIDDDYITQLILSAADCAQEYLHWMVSPGVVKQYAAVSNDLDGIRLYGRNISEITEITAKNQQGEDVTLTTDDYTYNDVTEMILISETLRGYTDFFITYSCGATPEQLPHNVRHGILMLISTMYNNREDFITGLSVANMPMSSYKLLKKSRLYVS